MIDSTVGGIRFGLQSYIFSALGLPHERLLDIVIESMVESGLGECDLFAPLVEPAGLAAAGLAAWRRATSPDYLAAIRARFETAGIAIYALSGFPGSDESELAWTFQAASTCGARLITLGAEVGLAAARRIAPLVESAPLQVALQGDPSLTPADPAAIARPGEYQQALAISPAYRISFDIGDAVGGGYDVIPFLETHHDRIALLYLKDRRRDGRSVPWGEGDTPIREVLRLIRDRRWPIRCYIDCDHPTADRPADVKRSFAFAQAALD